MIAPLFNNSQAGMYETTKTMWRNCLKYITEMQNFKAFYDDAYCNARIAEIEAAEAMKGEAARSFTHESLRLELLDLASTSRANWQALKMYISSVYTNQEMRVAAWKSAGWAYYDAASGNTWTAVSALGNAGKLYIAENTAALEANQNMPTTFVTKYSNDLKAFNDALSEFTQSLEDSETLTDAKNEANNAVYTKAIDMGADGQFVFRTEESKRKQFSYDGVSSIVAPAGASTVVITVIDAATDLPKENAEVTIGDRTVLTDVNGRAEAGNLAAGDVEIVVAADGFSTNIITMNLKTGTTSRETVTLTPLFVGAGTSEKGEIEKAAVPADNA